MQHTFRKPLQTLTHPNPDNFPPTSQRPSGGLQPHNFLLTSNGPDAKLKAADFGFSCFFQVKLLSAAAHCRSLNSSLLQTDETKVHTVSVEPLFEAVSLLAFWACRSPTCG